MPLRSGTRLGPYEILVQAGAGGMGEVYRARDTRLNRIVAVKVLPESFARDPERLQRFEHEACLLSSLNHPNLLSIYDVGGQDGVHYFVSEFLEGCTVRDRISEGPLTQRKSVEYALQIAKGLSSAHDKGIVHRDLKPENVFVTRDERVKLLDFGLARQTSVAPLAETMTQTSPALTAAGMVLGTAAYMSPEQVRGLPADYRSDIFSFGGILFEMITGRGAFRRTSAIESMTAILKEEIPEFTETDRRISPGLDRIVRRCMEKDPDQRFQSAKDLSFALQNLDTGSSAGLAIAIEPSTFKRRAWILASACLALVALGLALLLWRRPHYGPPQFAQLTNDPNSKASAGWPPPVFYSPIVGDGARLFFTVRTPQGAEAAQVAQAGGDVIPIPLGFSNATVLGISPNRSELLVESFTSEEVEDPEWIVPVLGGSPRRVGDIKAHDIAWSPDKQSFAYASGNSLYLLDEDGRKKRIYESAGIVIWPRWSPDGKRLRFTVEDPSRVSSVLWESRADGGGAHVLFPGWNKPAIECCGEWTPDGRYFIFQSGGIDDSQVWASREGWFGPEKPLAVTAGPLSFHSPVPAASGNTVFMVGSLSRDEVVRFDTKTGQVTPIPSIPSTRALEYSKDGKWICYVTAPDGDLWRSRPDGSERMQLTHAPVLAALPQWSPDGRQIAYVAFRVGQPAQIEIVSVDGDTPKPLIPESRHQGGGSWSPDGKSFFFGRLPWLEGDKATSVKLVRVDIASQTQTELAGTDGLVSPMVSPDGRFIAAVYYENASARLYDLATGRVTAITQESGIRPAWSRNGEYVLISTDSGKLIRCEVKTGRVATIGPLHRIGSGYTGWIDDPGFFTLAPDGAPVFARNTGSSSQVYSVNWQPQ